jgi:signal transduction histidine kinase
MTGAARYSIVDFDRGARFGFSVAGSLVVAAVVSAAVHPIGIDSVWPLLMTMGYLIAGSLYWRKTPHLEPREKRAWRAMALGVWSAAAGLLVTAVTVAVGIPVGAFGWIDVFFLSAYGFGIFGLWSLPSIRASGIRRTRIALDAVIGGLSIAALIWFAAVSEIVRSMEAVEAWRVAIGLAYPVFDVMALLSVIAVTLRRSVFRFDARLMFYGLGFAAQAVADLSYVRNAIGVTFAEVTPYFPAFLVASAFFVASSSLADFVPAAASPGEERNPWWAVAAPYLAVVALIALVLWQILSGGVPAATAELLMAAITVGLLVVWRQAAALREYRELVELRRSSLVSSVAHELRTPLTAVVGFLSIVADDAGDRADRDGLIQAAREQADHLARVVDDLVYMARETSEFALEVDEVRVDAVVDGVQTVMSDVTTDFETECEPGLVVGVDQVRIGQAIVNLLTNAARYGGDRRLLTIGSEGTTLTVEVHDNGAGVPHAHRSSIWRTFERGAHALDAAQPGSGLGLAIVDAIVRGHGGEVGYRASDRLGGACFWFRLPGRVMRHSRIPDHDPVAVGGSPTGRKR